MRKQILIQIFLSILVLIILVFVYQKYFKTELEKDAIINENSPKNNEKNNQENNLINITYDSIDREGRKYIITAETGNFKENEPDLIYMTNVNAKIILLDGSIIYINSLKA